MQHCGSAVIRGWLSLIMELSVGRPGSSSGSSSPALLLSTGGKQGKTNTLLVGSQVDQHTTELKQSLHRKHEQIQPTNTVQDANRGMGLFHMYNDLYSRLIMSVIVLFKHVLNQPSATISPCETNKGSSHLKVNVGIRIGVLAGFLQVWTSQI